MRVLRLMWNICFPISVNGVGCGEACRLGLVGGNNNLMGGCLLEGFLQVGG